MPPHRVGEKDLFDTRLIFGDNLLALKALEQEFTGGITEAVGWKGGGGFRYYAAAPSLPGKDPFGNWVISKKYNPSMLADLSTDSARQDRRGQDSWRTGWRLRGAGIGQTKKAAR